MSDQQHPDLLQRLLDLRDEWVAQRPSFSAQLSAIAREAVKDIRTTINEVFLDSPERGGEPGTPLNPTPQMVTQDLGTVHGSYNQKLDSYAARANEQSQENEKGWER
jgi:hypothetical protein